MNIGAKRLFERNSCKRSDLLVIHNSCVQRGLETSMIVPKRNNHVTKYIKPIYNSIKKISFRIRLIRMDHKWELGCCSCFNPFPPSFYYTHTEEEIERITEDMRNRLYALIEELQKENSALEKKEDTLKLEGKTEGKHIEECMPKKNENRTTENDEKTQ